MDRHTVVCNPLAYALAKAADWGYRLEFKQNKDCDITATMSKGPRSATTELPREEFDDNPDLIGWRLEALRQAVEGERDKPAPRLRLVVNDQVPEGEVWLVPPPKPPSSL